MLHSAPMSNSPALDVKLRAPAIEGAQTVDRACELLRAVARGGAAGTRIVDLCAATGLSRPTTHRILRSLAAGGLLRQDEKSRRYTLGPGMFELGLAAPSPIESFPGVRRVVEELARSTEDTVYLMLRSYDDVVCAWRAEGAYPIKANVVALGDRRPMGASAAGICILAGLPEEEAGPLIESNAPALVRFCKLDAARLRDYVREARRDGHVFALDLVMEGVAAVGMAVPAAHGRPYLGLSVSAIGARIPASRVESLAQALREATGEIARLTGGAAAG